MPIDALASLLARSGTIPPDKLKGAEQRRAIYGGSLDTALLEMGLCDEQSMLAHVAEATGIPAALPERVAQPDPAAADVLTISDARRLGAVPLEWRSKALELVVHPEADRAAIDAWAQARKLQIEPMVVLEVIFRELVAVVYGDPVPPRYCVLLGKLIGPDRARRWAMHRAPLPALAPPPVETGPQPRPVATGASAPSAPVLATGPQRRAPAGPLVRPAPSAAPASPPPAGPALLDDSDIEITIEATPAPPARPPPAIGELLSTLEKSREQLVLTRAIGALAERRATEAVPALIDRLKHADRHVATAAQTALVTITRQDFGATPRPWTAWWQKARRQHRVEWLLDALAHKRPDLRLAASEELQKITGVYHGYHFDLPEREREEARRRWSEWWRNVGRLQVAKGTLRGSP